MNNPKSIFASSKIPLIILLIELMYLLKNNLHKMDQDHIV